MVTTAPGERPQLPAGALDDLFPFHLAFGPDWRIVHSGRSMRRVCPSLAPGARFIDHFEPKRPEKPFVFADLGAATETLYIIQERTTGVVFRGQVLPLPDQGLILLLVSPWLPDPEAIRALGLSIDDFPIHDPALDLLHLVQVQKIAVGDLRNLTEKLEAQRTALREANEKLRQQESDARKLAVIVARTGNAVILTDASGHTEWVNDGFTRLTGFALEDMRGRNPWEVLRGPRTDAATVQYIHDQIRHGEGFSVELLHYDRKGRTYWVAVEAQPIRDTAGVVTNFMAIEADVTRRRIHESRLALQYRVSGALAEAEDILAGIPRVLRIVCEKLEWHAAIFWLVNPSSGRMEFADRWTPPDRECPALLAASRNPSFDPARENPGRIGESRQPIWIRDLAADSGFERAAAATRDGLRSGFGFPILVQGELWGVLEFFHRTPQEPDFELMQMFGLVADEVDLFIERRLADNRLRATSALQRAILDGASYSIIATDPLGNITVFNAMAERMLGYAASELVGRTTPALIHDPAEIAARASELSTELGTNITPGFEAFIAQARLGRPDQREWTYIRKDGTRFPVLLSITALSDENGTITGYLGIAEDITERKRAADELLRAKEAAEAANRAKSDFLATMSHEIRTPMNGILGMTELLLRTDLRTRQREFAEAVASSAEALLQVINDVLDFSKIEAGRLTLKEEEFSLRSLLDAVLEVCSPRAVERHLALDAIVLRNVPDRLIGDPIRLRQILVNLVGNGVKFTERGGVTARVSVPTGGQPVVQLRVEVVDTGVGMTQAQLSRLFRPFVQADSSTSRRYSGTGLGLAISRRLVELMGGRIGVRSEPGAGSTFWFEIPVRIPSQDTRALSHPALLHSRVLVGISTPSTAEGMVELCVSWGLSTEVCTTPGDMARRVESPHPGATVLLTDEPFLGPNGTHLLPSGTKPGVHAIVLVRSDSPLAVQEVVGSGLWRILLQPVKQSLLFDAMVTAIEGRAPDPAELQERFHMPLIHPDDFRHLRVLLAEDHPVNRRLSLLQLERFGCTADCAENGLEVLKRTAEGNYDVILMDCQMPEMDGYQTTAVLRQREAATGSGRRRIQIVALTANALVGERERCLAAGMDDYLAKPFTAVQLGQALRRAADQISNSGPAITPVHAALSTERLDLLCQELDVASVVEMVREFTAELPSHRNHFQQLSHQGSRDDIHRAAHKLKGAAASFGLDALAESSRLIEKAAASGPQADLPSLIRRLIEGTRDAEENLNRWIDAQGLLGDGSRPGNP